MWTDLIFAAIIFAAIYLNVFHLLLWFEERDKIRGKGRSRRLPILSVIVPAFNEEKTIARTLKKILASNYPKNKLEVIVVDDGSTDATAKVAGQFKGVKVLRKPRGGKASALNYGLRHAKGELVAVVDADSLLHENALRNCVEFFDEPSVAAVTSHILPKGRSFLERMQRLEFMTISLARKLQEKLNIIYATPGPLSVYRKNVLLALGGFDERNLTEDIEICWRIQRAGYKVKMAYNARVYSIYPSSLRTWFKQRARWNIGGLQTLAKHFGAIFDQRKHPVKIWHVPLFTVSAALALLGLAVLTYLWLLYLVKQVGFFLETLALGGNVLRTFTFGITLDVFFILGVTAFITTLVSLKIVLDEYKEEFKIWELLCFLCFYVLLFPLAFGYSLLRVMLGKVGWFTK